MFPVLALSTDSPSNNKLHLNLEVAEWIGHFKLFLSSEIQGKTVPSL
jgi:hypothetical protein